MLIISILLLIVFNLLLAYIPWIPSLRVEIFVYSLTVVLYLFVIHLSYRFISGLRFKIALKSMISIFWIIVLLGVMFINLVMYSGLIRGISFSKNTFESKTFYLYETGLVDSIVELRVKHDFLPIESDTLFIINNHGKVSLERVGNIIYLIHTMKTLKKVEKIKIYDLELNKDFSDDYAFLSNDKAINKNVPSISLVPGLIVYSYDKV